MTPAEFSRPVRLDSLGSEVRALTIAAERGEREALARRFGLIELTSLTAEVGLGREGEEVKASGRIEAAVVQACVASGEPVEDLIRESFDLSFRPASPPAAGDEVELRPNELDELPYEGGAIDIGEAVAETLALALDRFPRSPGAEQALREAGVISEQEAGPFAALAALKLGEAARKKGKS